MKYNNTKMFKVLNIIFIFIFLYACGQDNAPNKIKLSSLINAEFTYTQDLFDCELNKNQSLIALEAFFSKNIKKYKDLAELENLNISILFPEQNNNITNFNFSKSDFGLSNMDSHLVKYPKFKELQTVTLINCLWAMLDRKRLDLTYCVNNNPKEVYKELFKRLVSPFYLPVLTLISLLLILISKENIKYSKNKYMCMKK